VGKTSFCNKLASSIDANLLTASELIKERRSATISIHSKQVESIDQNQEALLLALDEKRKSNKMILLDGHFTLLTKDNKIEPIDIEVFKRINPQFILVLQEKPEIIQARLKQRDRLSFDLNTIDQHQKLEILQAKLIANSLNISCINISSDGNELDNIKKILAPN